MKTLWVHTRFGLQMTFAWALALCAFGIMFALTKSHGLWLSGGAVVFVLGFCSLVAIKRRGFDSWMLQSFVVIPTGITVGYVAFYFAHPHLPKVFPFLYRWANEVLDLLF